MARTPKRLATATLSATTRATIYTAPAGINTSATVLTFTNNSASSIIINIYVGTGTDFLQIAMTLPAGIGRKRTYYDLGNINATDTVKLQADSVNVFNYNLSGSEIEL